MAAVVPHGSSLLTYEMRLDGFVYLAAASTRGATFTTAPVIWLARDLLVNADAARHHGSGGSSVTVASAHPLCSTGPSI